MDGKKLKNQNVTIPYLARLNREEFCNVVHTKQSLRQEQKKMDEPGWRKLGITTIMNQR